MAIWDALFRKREYFLEAFPFVDALAAGDRLEGDAGGEGEGVDDVDFPFELVVCNQAGVLIGLRDLARKGEVDDVVGSL